MALDLESRTPKTRVLASGTTNIPTAFSTASGSLALSNISYVENMRIVNGAASVLVLNVTAGDASNAPSTDEVTIAASETAVFNNMKISSTVYVRSGTGSAISSGNVVFNVW